MATKTKKSVQVKVTTPRSKSLRSKLIFWSSPTMCWHKPGTGGHNGGAVGLNVSDMLPGNIGCCALVRVTVEVLEEGHPFADTRYMRRGWNTPEGAKLMKAHGRAHKAAQRRIPPNQA